MQAVHSRMPKESRTVLDLKPERFLNDAVPKVQR